MPRSDLRAVLLDKDGTLFDFAASWSGWMAGVIDTLSDDVPSRATAIAQAVGFDRAAKAFSPHSPVIAGTLDEAAALIRPHLSPARAAGLETYLLNTATQARMVPPVPLVPLLDGLRARGLVLGVATNDAEAAARAHLDAHGATAHFAQVLGYDSGPAPKPAPDMLLAFARGAGLAPAQVAMVGDSPHDLHAGRAAGMVTIGVLTGLADRATLAPLADSVLPDIGQLPGWLDGASERAP